MWYEMLIPCSAIVLFTSLPRLLGPLHEEYTTGNKYYKNTQKPMIETFWFRDMYLTGNPMKPTGVDAIPDLPEDIKK
ncbi:hypothetical protein PGB90_005605 [Kerria lacca]